jgi:hypothetical protein
MRSLHLSTATTDYDHFREVPLVTAPGTDQYPNPSTAPTSARR